MSDQSLIVDREEQYRLRPPVNGGIPKTFHMIWNHSPVPESYKGTRAALMDLHPHWGLTTWQDEEIWSWLDEEKDGPLAALVKAIEHAYLESDDKRQVSDLVRVGLIWRYGGVYIDWDWSFQKNFDPLIEGAPCVLTTMHGRNRPTVANGFMAAEPGDEFIKYLLDNLVESYFSKGGDTVQRTGPSFTSRMYKAYLNDNMEAGCRLLEKWVLCPNSYWQAPRAGGYPDSFAVHQWATRHDGVWDGKSPNPSKAQLEEREMLL